MDITITTQKLGGQYSQSAGDFVDYLEKENQGFIHEEMEHFFNQYGDEISAKDVIKEIDGNTAKLKKKMNQNFIISRLVQVNMNCNNCRIILKI